MTVRARFLVDMTISLSVGIGVADDGGIVAEAELGHALERQDVAQTAPKKALSVLEGGARLVGAGRTFARGFRELKPNASARDIARQFDARDVGAVEARVVDLAVEQRIHFFAKQFLEPQAAKARDASGAIPRPFFRVGHGWCLPPAHAAQSG